LELGGGRESWNEAIVWRLWRRAYVRFGNCTIVASLRLLAGCLFDLLDALNALNARCRVEREPRAQRLVLAIGDRNA